MAPTLHAETDGQETDPGNETPTLSELIRYLKDPDPEVQMMAAGDLSAVEPWDAQRWAIREGIPEAEAKEAARLLIQMTKNRNEKTRTAGMIGLSHLGPLGLEALPQILRLLKEAPKSEGENVSMTASFAGAAILAMGPAAIPAVTEALQGADGPLRSSLEEILQMLSENETAGIAERTSSELEGKPLSELVEPLKDPDPWVRIAAAGLLANRWKEATPSEIRMLLDPLAEMLRDDREEVRNAADNAFYWMTEPYRKTPPAGKVIPLLIELLKDENEYVWREANFVLARLGREAIPALTEALKGSDPKARERIENSLREIRKDEQALGIALSEEEAVRVALPVIYAKDIPPLIRQLEDPNPDTRFYAALQFSHLRADLRDEAESAIPTLIRNLEDADGRIRQRAAVALGLFGFHAKEAVYPLILAMRDPDVADHAATALVRIQSLQLVSFYPHPHNRWPQIASELKRRAPSAQAAVPVLLSFLESDDAAYRWQAAFLLAALGLDGAQSLNSLLEKAEGNVRSGVLEALKLSPKRAA